MGVVSASPECQRCQQPTPNERRKGRKLNVGRREGQAVPAIRHRQSLKPLAEIAENAEIDGNEGLQRGVHPVAENGKSLAETAETPCKNFAREAVRSFTVSLSGSTQGAPRTSGFAMRYPSSGRCVHAVAV